MKTERKSIYRGLMVLNSIADRIVRVRAKFDESKKVYAELVEKEKPDILVKGGDWSGKEIVGREHAGVVSFFHHVAAISTSEIRRRAELSYINTKLALNFRNELLHGPR